MLINDLLVQMIWLLLSSYAVFTLALVFLWNRIPRNYTIFQHPTPTISVIIPVRNEVQNIGFLLDDLQNQTYDKKMFEILVMDDASTDGTAELVRQHSIRLSGNIRLISLPDIPVKSPKKRAIETAMLLATGELIVTTDGDCRVGTDWLRTLSDCYRATGAKLLSGPVTFNSEQSLTDHLQTVEFSSLVGSGASAISAGFPSLCNGANLAYTKTAFEAVKGYDGVRHIASGDDEFLMHKIEAQFPGSIHFVKNADAIVRTGAHQDWSLFFRQRKRWASKWKHYQSKTPLALALYIFGCNFCLIAATILCALGSIPLSLLSLFWLVKCAPEWIFIGTILGFLKKPGSLIYILPTQLIYPFYVCLFGLAAQSPQYEWKGRKLT